MPNLPSDERVKLIAALRADPSGYRRGTGGLDWTSFRVNCNQLSLFEPANHEAETPAHIEDSHKLLQEWRRKGFQFLPVSDPKYPANLRRSQEPPAFIFAQGKLRPEDRISVAIVGSRRCTEAGRRRAAKLARGLATEGITVVSGLALGIDTAAHQGALAARAGRTIAVIGTGLQMVYPPENRDLQRIIAERGAIISPFWPDFADVKGGASFLLRNRVMANLTLATVVVEASFRSGARSQAAYARRSGRPVFLLRSLVQAETWAQDLARKPDAYVIGDIDELLCHLSHRVLACRLDPEPSRNNS